MDGSSACLPSYSFSLIRACICWSVGFSPTICMARLSCFVEMRPFLSWPKYWNTSRYSVNENRINVLKIEKHAGYNHGITFFLNVL